MLILIIFRTVITTSFSTNKKTNNQTAVERWWSLQPLAPPAFNGGHHSSARGACVVRLYCDVAIGCGGDRLCFSGLCYAVVTWIFY
jgi:hypothetical protein